MVEIVQYETPAGRCPFADWFSSLDAHSALKVRSALARMELKNFGDAKSVGEGVFERRIDWGPGLRIYYGRDGIDLVVLVGGGTKKRQDGDIAHAKQLWAEYKLRKKER
jgi:putative addiction module killer protein